MNKFIIILCLLVSCASLITGCNSQSNTTAPATTTAQTLQPAATTTTAPASTTAKPAATITTAPASTTAKPTPTSVSQTPLIGGTLIYIQSTAPGTPIGWPPEAAGATMNALEIPILPLLEEESNGNIKPRLAASYTVEANPDNASITLTLKKGIKFQDGTDLNAQAVKWNFTQLLTGTMTSSSQYWKSFDVLDDYTIRVNFKGWQNRYVRSFGGPAASMVSPTAYEKNGLDWMRWNMVGTGPFKQVEFVKDVSLKLVKFDDYYEKGKPYLQGINIIYVADELTRMALFKSGGGHIMGVSSPMTASQLQAAGYTIVTGGGTNTWLLLPDTMNNNSPWANSKVRLAAEYAIDKEGITKAFGYGYWNPAYQMPDKGSNAYNPALAPRKYDAAKAKQLLTEAGYPNGFKSAIISSIDQNRDVMVAIQSQLKAIGIEVEIQVADSAKYSSYQQGTWNNALLFASSYTYPNFNNTLNQWFAPTGPWFKSLKKPVNWQDLFNTSLTSPVPVVDLMQKCVQAFYDDSTVIPVYSVGQFWVTNDKVHDAGLGELGTGDQWKPFNAWLSK